MPGMQLATILAKGLVPHIVSAVLNRPMTTPQRRQMLGSSVCSGQARDAVDHLVSDCACAQIDRMVGALHDLRSPWPAQVLIQFGAGHQGTFLFAPMGLVVQDQGCLLYTSPSP